MSMEYIRRTYGVPAKRGGRLVYTGSDGVKFWLCGLACVNHNHE